MDHITEDDYPYEADLARSPYSVDAWLRYVDHKRPGDVVGAFVVYERALKEMPASYKLWMAYIQERILHLKRKASSSELSAECALINGIYERALVYLHRMPRLWIDYGRFLCRQRAITAARRCFDRGLQSLPCTLHARIWDVYLKMAAGIQESHPETALHIQRRYAGVFQAQPELLQLLLATGRVDEALSATADEESVCQMVVEHATRVQSVSSVAARLRGFQSTRAWNALCSFLIQRGDFEGARDAYWEALSAVHSVRDFALLYGGFAKFEETLLTVLLSEVQGCDDAALLALAKYEHLLEQRPVLLAEVRIRQRPNDAARWAHRISLEPSADARVALYERAIATIKPGRVLNGALPALWISFARLYRDDLDTARAIMERALRSGSKSAEQADEQADLWIGYAAIDAENRFEIMARAVRAVPKSAKLWSHFVDLEEARGLLEPTRACYDAMVAAKVVSPQQIINYALFLEDVHGLPEEAFRVYERGIDLFGWPVAFDLWNIFLPKYCAYGPSMSVKRLERIRELYEQALRGCPAKYARDLYLMYAKTEAEHGLARTSLSILKRACAAVPDEDRATMYRLLIDRTQSIQGISEARDVYAEAIRVLPESDARAMCCTYAALETQLGEFERARAVYGHAAQFSDPRTAPSLWDAWLQFETKHGDEGSFREMLRVKRAVQARFSDPVSFVLSSGAAAGAVQDETVPTEPGNAEEVTIRGDGEQP